VGGKELIFQKPPKKHENPWAEKSKMRKAALAMP
jgi:hypothetical protein